MKLPETFKHFAEVVIDGYFIVDRDRTIVDFNRSFRAMFPRSVARKLKGAKCYDVMRLSICKDRCIAEQCWANGKQVRLDEIRGTLSGAEQERHFILSGIPIHDEAGNVVGAMEVQRDITDDVIVGRKYKEQVEQAETQISDMKQTLAERNRELLTKSRDLERARLELFRAKTGVYS